MMRSSLSLAPHPSSLAPRPQPPVPTLGIGAGLWLVAMALLQARLEEALLLLAPLVVVPLGLRLLDSRAAHRLEALARRAVLLLQLPAAALLVGAFALPVGGGAAALAGPWLLVTLLCAAWGAVRLATRPWKVAELATDAALLFIAVGGLWTLLSRFGWWPGGFEPIIALLTGVHFHYAGFALPLVLAQQAVALPGRGVPVALVTIATGTPLLAIGISFSPTVEVVAAGVLLIGTVLVAAQWRQALRCRQPAEITLFAVSGLSLLAGMGLAALYALSEFTGSGWIDIPTMIPLHGLANAVGFALLGLGAWSLKRSASSC